MSNIAFLFLPLAFSSLPAVLPFVSPSSQVLFFMIHTYMWPFIPLMCHTVPTARLTPRHASGSAASPRFAGGAEHLGLTAGLWHRTAVLPRAQRGSTDLPAVPRQGETGVTVLPGSAWTRWYTFVPERKTGYMTL